MKAFWISLAGTLFLGLPPCISASPENSAAKVKPEQKVGVTYDQSKVPLEIEPKDPKLIKIVLIAGHASHGPGEHEFFAGCALLMNLLRETPGIFPVMVRDGWPKDTKVFDGARSVVFYMDGGSGHPIIQDGHMEEVKKLMIRGVGFVNLHYAVEYPKKQGQQILEWLGGYYETGYSINPTWKADFQSLPEHPISRGVHPFSILDEWYYNIRFSEGENGVTPLLQAIPPDNTRGTVEARKHPGRMETLAWAFERGDGRAFGFTGGHFHRNWGEEDFRRLVVNGILWTAHIQIPKGGAKVDLNRADLDKNLDRK